MSARPGLYGGQPVMVVPTVIAKTLKSQLLHSFEVLDPIRFPRFSAIG